MLQGDEVLRGRLTHSQTLIVSESIPSTRSIPEIRSLGVVAKTIARVKLDQVNFLKTSLVF
jgi:hypothetical protein